jgi:formylglycine-generating enzyme required for sulfatase activity
MRYAVGCIFMVLAVCALITACGGDSGDAGSSDGAVSASGGSSSAGNSPGGNSSGASGGDPFASHVMVPIPAGSFTMGSAHVTLTKDFLMGKYQVTQGLYEEVMWSNPSSFLSDPADGEAQGMRPVEQVRWYDVLVFCNKLSVLEELTPVYAISGTTDPLVWGGVPTGNNSVWNAVTMDGNANGYRLPTEAEWEYACRAGTDTAYNLGDTWSDDWGWYSGNSNSMTHEVGKKTPNAWGLYDMHGNVWEWVWDWYGALGTSAMIDPTGPASGSGRVHRGGGWSFNAESLASAYRYLSSASPHNGYDSLGFRLARND